MKNSFDTDSILFKLFNNSELKRMITGDVHFQGDRPTDSNKEDVVINTLTLSQDHYPQIGDSNINIYVADNIVTIGGKQQNVANRKRLKELTDKTIEIIRNSKIEGLLINLKWQRVFSEPDINQHFVNIRVSWNIHI